MSHQKMVNLQEPLDMNWFKSIKKWFKIKLYNFQYRNYPDEVCCCGSDVGKGGDICYHGGCKSIKDYNREKL